MKTNILTKLKPAVLGAAMALAFVQTASAVPTFYTSEAAFQTAATTGGVTLTTENLDTVATGSLPKSTPTDITITSEDSGPSVASGGYGSGNVIRFSTQSGGTSITFTFLNPVYAFGLSIFDLGTVGATNLTLTTAEGAQIVFNNFTGSTGNERFAGVVDLDTAFVSATITNTQPGDYVELDDLQFGGTKSLSVPDNGSTVMLLGASLIGLALFQHRRMFLKA